jgi:hypothetical protein
MNAIEIVSESVPVPGQLWRILWICRRTNWGRAGEKRLMRRPSSRPRETRTLRRLARVRKERRFNARGFTESSAS